jgi:Putative transposase
MAETAAHLADQVFPPLPVRQWVLAVPKRLRYFLQRDSEALGAVLHILLRVIEARLRQRSGCALGRLGAVSFVQRFGSALNAHVHFHCCVIDGVFAVGEDGQVHFAEADALTPEDLAAVQQQVRARVLRWFARAGTLDPADARDMAGWHHGGGFSLDAAVRIDGHDRAGLERLLRYCARPPFALERLEQLPDGQIVYRFPKPQPDGTTQVRLTPLELIERLAALIPPPRIHRHRYHGVLAPNSPQRA